MSKLYFDLSNSEKRELLEYGAQQLGRRAEVLEKDVWVCWALHELFDMPDALQMAFKGGTSLSKVYKVIERFSEDVDVTVDYRGLDPNATALLESGPSKSRLKKLSKELKEALRGHVHDTIKPHLEAKAANIDATIEVDESGENLRVHFPSASGSLEYLREHVLLEFGGRNMTEPSELADVVPDIAHLTDSVMFQNARPYVLDLRRTFWEKVTAIHTFCNGGKIAGVRRQARHWYDIHQILQSAHRQPALESTDILASVIQHKSTFYASSYAKYDDCLTGDFNLLPTDTAELRADYVAMQKAGMFYEESPAFDQIVNSFEMLSEALKSSTG